MIWHVDNFHLKHRTDIIKRCFVLALHYSAIEIEITPSMTIHNWEQCHSQGYLSEGWSNLYFLCGWYSASYFFWVSGGSECHFCFCFLGHTKGHKQSQSESLGVNPDTQEKVMERHGWEWIMIQFPAIMINYLKITKFHQKFHWTCPDFRLLDFRLIKKPPTHSSS